MRDRSPSCFHNNLLPLDSNVPRNIVRMRRQNARNGIKKGNVEAASLDMRRPRHFVTGLLSMTWQLVPLIIPQKQKRHVRMCCKVFYSMGFFMSICANK